VIYFCDMLHKQDCHPETAEHREGPLELRAKAFLWDRSKLLVGSLFILWRIGMTTVLAAVFSLTIAQTAFAVGGVDTPPLPSARHETKFAAPRETQLANGLRVLVAERPGLPLLGAQVLIRSGAEIDREGFAGTASLTGDLLTKGTETMSAPEIARAVESLGGSIDSGAGWDASGASLVVMSNNADKALQILADVVRHPAFKQEEIDRLKSQRLDGLRVAMQQPASLARYVTSRVVYGAGAYGHAAGGTLEKLGAIGRVTITGLFKK
jgi:zinc protease